MPNDIVNAVHRLAAASKQGGGITFTDKDGNLRSKIMPTFPENTIVTTSRNDVEYVVTEFGIAHLRYKSIMDRAKALISVSHPDFRDELKFEAKKRKWM